MATSPANRVGAVFVASENPRRLAEFYRSAFVLGEPAESGDSVGMAVGDLYLGFEQLDGHASAGGRTTVWFAVEDVATTLGLMLQAGARERTEPDDRCSPGEVLATVFDIDGNIVGLIGPAPKPVSHLDDRGHTASG